VSLDALGVAVEVVDPDSRFWPIITDDVYQDANPILEETRKMVVDLIVPLLRKGVVPVICGFLGRTRDGQVTTLGRGGGDTTAVLLGSCLEAREVLLVKDVEGVFSSDPAKVSNPRIVESLDREEADLLAVGGAKFLHRKALQYQAPGLAIRVMGMDGRKPGTLILGKKEGLRVELLPQRVSMLTVVGWNAKADSVSALHSAVNAAGGTLLALSVEPKSALLYVGDGEGALNAVHDLVVGRSMSKAVSSFDGLSMISIKGGGLETTPGLVQKVAGPLGEAKINIYGIVTISSSIKVFVKEDDAKRASRMIREALGVGA
jgi:aspartate kinase